MTRHIQYCVCGTEVDSGDVRTFCDESGRGSGYVGLNTDETEVHEPRHDVGPCLVCNVPEENAQIVRESQALGLYDEPPMPTSAQSHYKELSPEPIEVIRAWGLDRDFYLGNVVKYIARHQKKNGLEDLQKAAVYLQWAIERLQAVEESVEAVNVINRAALAKAAQIDGPNLDVSGN